MKLFIPLIIIAIGLIETLVMFVIAVKKRNVLFVFAAIGSLLFTVGLACVLHFFVLS